VGIEGKLKLYGLPSWATRWVGSEGGLYLVLGANIGLNGELGRKVEGGGIVLFGALSGTGTVAGGLEVKVELSDYVEVTIQGTTGISVTVTGLVDTVGIGRSLAGHWGGLTIAGKAKLNVLGEWEYSPNPWTPISPVPIWEGETHYVRTW